MIRFNLRKCLKYLETRSERKITLKEVAEKSGCDKNALSRLINHPEVMPSSGVIDKLVQYFFFARKELDEIAAGPGNKPTSLESRRMQRVIGDFVNVYPDSPEYWNVIPEGMKEDPAINLDNIWAIYDRITNPEPLAKLFNEDVTKPLNSLLEKLVVGLKSIEKDKANITLSEQEITFLLNRLPMITGASGNDLANLLKLASQIATSEKAEQVPVKRKKKKTT